MIVESGSVRNGGGWKAEPATGNNGLKGDEIQPIMTGGLDLIGIIFTFEVKSSFNYDQRS